MAVQVKSTEAYNYLAGVFWYDWGEAGYSVYLPVVLRNYSPSSTATDVRTDDVEYDPPSSNVDREYVLIVNYGGTVDMTGWTLRDEANHTYTFPTFTLGSGASVQVWSKSGTDTATDLYWGSGSAIWNNTGDTAYLRDDLGSLVDSYSY